MDIISSFREKLRCRNFSVVLPEGKDERIICAARRLKDEGIAEPVVPGKAEDIAAAVQKASLDLSRGATVDDIVSSTILTLAQLL